jgi:hypothetical protein
MKTDLTVESPEVRAIASELAATGHHVSAGVADTPATVAIPRWATSDATSRAADAIRRQLTEIGADITATAREIVAAVLDYEAADERSASRMRAAA